MLKLEGLGFSQAEIVKESTMILKLAQLGKAGLAKYDEMTINGTQMTFYRKPKRFGGLKTSL